MTNSLRPHGQYGPWNSPGQNTGVGSLSLLQGIFQTQGLNPGIPHCRLILYQLSHQGSPRIQEWVAYPFSRGSSWPRNWTRVSCIASVFFTSWATRESLVSKGGASPKPQGLTPIVLLLLTLLGHSPHCLFVIWFLVCVALASLRCWNIATR